MSYRINDQHLFDDLTDEEAQDLEEFATEIVLQGRVDVAHPAFVIFKQAIGVENVKQMLIYSTSFPQRALLSLLKR